MNLYQTSNNQLIEALNFIYTGSSNNITLEGEVLRRIRQGGRKNANLINQLQVNQPSALNNWLGVYNQVKKDYDDYLNELKKASSQDIEVLIVAEAPLLSVDDSGGMKANYIFSPCSVGSYRNVPYEAISSIKGSSLQVGYKTSAVPLIDLFKKHHVGFVDLVPIPLPQISSKLRNDWSDRNQKCFQIQNKPHIVDMLENAVNHFRQVTQRKFSKNLVVIFMMPRNTATGIFDYCTSLKVMQSNSFLHTYKQNILLTSDGSKLTHVTNQNRELCKQMVNAKSGYPSVSRFINALL